jgi:hypothetical protein
MVKTVVAKEVEKDELELSEMWLKSLPECRGQEAGRIFER